MPAPRSASAAVSPVTCRSTCPLGDRQLQVGVCDPFWGQRVDVWQSGPVGQLGQRNRDPHSEPANEEHLTAIR